MICKNCGKEISDKSMFCGYCGAKVVEQPILSQSEAVKENKDSKFHFYNSDLITLWKVAGNPFQGNELSFSASVVIVVLNLIANILILRCIICGIGLTIFFVGSIYTYCYVNRKKDKNQKTYIVMLRELYLYQQYLYYLLEYSFSSRRLKRYGYGRYFYQCRFAWVLYLRHLKVEIGS